MIDGRQRLRVHRPDTRIFGAVAGARRSSWTTRVVPSPAVVTPIPAEADASFTFNIPFRTDDGGQDLYANFILDFDPIKLTGTVQQQVPGSVDRPAALRRADRADRYRTSRSVSWTWSIPRPLSACHALTMILTRTDNFNGLYTAKDDLQAAQVTLVPRR